MKSSNDSSRFVSWCLKQKRGIKLEEPNDNLCKAYIEKAKSALNMLDSAIEKDEADWIATTAYYSRYFALYALLKKCGVKSEIHNCTISLMRFLFVEEKMIEEQFYDELILAKDLRIDTQYYVTEQIDKEKLKTNSEKAKNFVLKIEEIIEKITEAQMSEIRDKLAKARLQKADS